MLFGMPHEVCANVRNSNIVERIYTYGDSLRSKRVNTNPIAEEIFPRSVYMDYDYYARKRNFILFFIPSMYTIAKGERHYKGESFGYLNSLPNGEYTVDSVVYSGTAKRYDRTMPMLMKYMTPTLYDMTMFEKQILSPFHRCNKKFYNYTVLEGDSSVHIVYFAPKITNTQLVKGSAIVDNDKAEILHTTIDGDFDMLRFSVDIDLEKNNKKSIGEPVVKSCEVNTLFRFVGNDVDAKLHTRYDSPDSLKYVVLRNKQRIMTLSDTTLTDTLAKKETLKDFRDAAWNFVGDYLLSSRHTELSKLRISMSPLFNPLHLGYNHSNGLSYKMNIGTYYTFMNSSTLSFDLKLGYNFKHKQFFFTAPLRYTFKPHKHGWVEMTFANGNRISDSKMLELIKDASRDTLDFEALNLNYFDDKMLCLDINHSLSKYLDLSVGTTYHKRTAINASVIEELGRQPVYRSFSPTLTMTYIPFTNGPTFTGIYERSIKGVLSSNMEYEKYEFDASFEQELSGLRRYSLRFGGGFYTNMTTTYFVDFVNFHENYLPHGWDDDWEGQFQLLNSQWYNASKYYVRLNTSYESPLMIMSRMPLVGRYVETERFYFSVLQIEKTSPYTEFGYAFTNRYFSVGIFSGCVGGKLERIGCKFSFELFRRW